ncbi:MAG: hypothetical protein QNK47_07760, partial [Oceanospirillaceae bacterium]|jgi:hypothetical protein
MILKFKTTILYVAVFGLGALAMWFAPHMLNGSHNYAEQMKAHHGSSEEGQVNHSHDEVNMPGLQGKDTTENEVDDLKTIFKNHKQITRTVENISNGITTTTETTDDKLRDALVSHVVAMVARLEEKRDPKIIIQSPTLDKLFAESDAIQTNITMTELGIVVTQTSTNPIVVKTLQTHAAEVSDMARRGMEAVHERMLN